MHSWLSGITLPSGQVFVGSGSGEGDSVVSGEVVGTEVSSHTPLFNVYPSLQLFIVSVI